MLVYSVWLANGWRQAKRWKMADELAGATIFWGYAKANADNTAFVYGQRSKTGVALYLQNAAGNKSLIWERKEGDFNPSILRVQGWSPDGSYFAFVCDGHARIRAGNDGRQVADINVGGGLGNFVWLSPTRIAAFTWRDLYLISRESSGWTKTKLYSVPSGPAVSSLLRLSGDSVAWRLDNDVWTYDLGRQAATHLSNASTNPVLGLSISEADGSLLLNCGTNGGDLFRCFPEAPDRPWVEVGKLGGPGDYIYKAYELDRGRSYAYLTSNQRDRDSRPAVENKNFTLLIQHGMKGAPARVLGEREIEDCDANGDHLNILGTCTNEPPGLWDYAVKADALRCICAALPVTQHCQFSTPEYETTTNALGEPVGYYVWPPTHLVAGKKYPVVVTQTTYRWMLEAEIAASSGYYFALTERPSWFSRRIQSWGEDVKAVCADLASQRGVDTNRVFLSSVSTMESYPLKEFMEENPGFAQGAFLQSGFGPESLGGHPAEIEMLTGDRDDSLKLDFLKKYQETAARDGVAVRLVLRKGPHSTLTQENQIEFARQYADFLYLNE
jgi:hypothetical protein